MDNMNKPADPQMLHNKMKETWGKMSDDDIKLYQGSRAQFFAKLKEKQNVSQADAEKRMQEFEASLAVGTSTGKSDSTKAA